MGSRNYNAGRRLEKRTAEALTKLTGERFKRVPLSGALPDMPGDVEGPNDLIQDKYSSALTSNGEKSIRILKSDLLKIEEQAASKGKRPALVFAFKGDTQQWAITTLERFAETL